MIYFVQRASDQHIKIGYTEMYGVRFNALKKQFGELDLLGAMEGNVFREHELHAQFTDLRIRKTEWFRPGENLLEFIQANTKPLDTEYPVFVRAPVSRTTRQAIHLIALQRRASTSSVLNEMIQFNLELWSEDNRQLLKKLAKKNRMSLAAYVRLLMQTALEVAEPEYVIDMSAGLSSWGDASRIHGDDE